MLKTLAHKRAPIRLFLRRSPLTPMLEPARLERFKRLAEQQSGPILEVGCFRGATTVSVCRHLAATTGLRPYVAVDTFAGFVADQFRADVALGTPERARTAFAGNPMVLVERTVRHYGLTEHVAVVQADICEIPAEQLPDQIGVCLLDVDLAVPIRDGLRKIVPRLRPGGVVLVDDCDGHPDWPGGLVGYQQYCQETGRPERIVDGLGMITV